jgi:beta-N-acetylhexosaminidase
MLSIGTIFMLGTKLKKNKYKNLLSQAFLARATSFLLAAIMLGQLGSASALSKAQKNVLDAQIRHFNVASGCNSGDSIAADTAPIGATGGTGSLKIPEDFTIDQKIGQMLIVQVDSREKAVSLEKQYQIGGFYSNTSGSNLYSNKSATDEVKKAGKIPAIVAVDEEGGQVDRLGIISQSAKSMGSLTDDQVQAIAQGAGKKMADLGITVDFAPILDLDNGKNAAISGPDRAFSSDPNVVAKKAGEFAQGLQSANIVPTFKHFPGLGHVGSSGADTSGGNTDTTSSTAPSLTVLKSRDLRPYETVLEKGTSAVMMGNQKVPGLTNGELASLSPDAYKLLRNNYGFDQVIFTDALPSYAGSLSSTVTKAIEAGADMPLINDPGAVGGIIDNVNQAVDNNRISQAQIDSSIHRILDLKNNGPSTGSTAPVPSSCCNNGGDGGSGTALSGDSPGEQVFNYFTQTHHLSNESAAAVTGNLQVESDNFRVIDGWGGGGGNYYGLAQWSRNDRYPKLVTFAHGTANAAKLNYQLDFVWHELDNGYESTLQNLQGNSSIEDKAIFWGRHYEIAVDPDGSLQMQAERIANAKVWLGKANGAPTPTSAPTTSTTDTTCADSAVATGIGGYSNPFHSTSGLVQSRIDEGVDYAAEAGKKVPLYAMGKGKITKVTNHSTFYTTSGGHADWITYQLTDGPAAGKYVYVSEACTIVPEILSGAKTDVDASTKLCDVLPDSIEMGWALDSTSQAAAAVHVYREGYETAYGVNFNKLLVKLGAPGGHLDTRSDPSGTVLGSLPAGWPEW